MARGRKPKGEFSGKSAVFSTRIQGSTRQRLEDAARESGRSLSQEVERRLLESFETDRHIDQTFGERRNYAFFRLLDMIVRETRAADPARPVFWLDDPFRYRQAVVAITTALEVFRPTEKLPEAAPGAHQALDNLGLLAVGAVLNDVRTADPKKWDGHYTPEIGVQRELRDMVDRIPQNFFEIENVKAFLRKDKP